MHSAIEKELVRYDIFYVLRRKALMSPGITEDYKAFLEDRIDGMAGYFEKQLFQQEMSRFLDKAELSETAAKPEFVASLSAHLADTLTSVHGALYSSKKTAR